MTYADAMDYYNTMKAEEDLGSSSSGFSEQVRSLSEFNRLKNKAGPKPRRWTLGDVIHGAIGAGLGAGIAKGVSAFLPLSAGFKDKLQLAAAGLGAAMNVGIIKKSMDEEIEELEDVQHKIAAQRRDAFKFGFLKAAHKVGYFDKAAAVVAVPAFNLSPAALLSIPRGVASTITRGGGMIGTAAGIAQAPDETEEELTKLQIHREILEEQLGRLKSERTNQVLRKLLAKRRQ